MINSGRKVEIQYPGWGRITMYNAIVEGDLVVGDVWDEWTVWSPDGTVTKRDAGWRKMNFPKSAIKRWLRD